MATARNDWPVLPDVGEPAPPRQRRAWGKVSHEERYRRQRRDLLRAAARLAARKGYPGTRVGDIVAEAGLSKTTFYEHFSSKDDCFGELYRRVSAGMVRAGVEAAEETEGDTPYARILAVVRALVGYVEQDPRLASVLRTELSTANDEIRAQREQNLQAIAGLFVTLGQRLGTELEPEELQLTAQVVVHGVTDMLPELERRSIPDELPRVAALCCRALGFPVR